VRILRTILRDVLSRSRNRRRQPSTYDVGYNMARPERAPRRRGADGSAECCAVPCCAKERGQTERNRLRLGGRGVLYANCRRASPISHAISACVELRRCSTAAVDRSLAPSQTRHTHGAFASTPVTALCASPPLITHTLTHQASPATTQSSPATSPLSPVLHGAARASPSTFFWVRWVFSARCSSLRSGW